MSLGRAKRHLFQGTPPFSYDTSAGGTVQADLTRKSGPLWPNWPTVANLVHCSQINPLKPLWLNWFTLAKLAYCGQYGPL